MAQCYPIPKIGEGLTLEPKSQGGDQVGDGHDKDNVDQNASVSGWEYPQVAYQDSNFCNAGC